jgi:hypothetical protein
MLQWTNRQDVVDVFKPAADKKTLKLPSDTDDPGRSEFYRQVMGMLSQINSAERRLKTYFAMRNLRATCVDGRGPAARRSGESGGASPQQEAQPDYARCLGSPRRKCRRGVRPTVPSLFASRTRNRATGPQVEHVTIEDLSVDSDDLDRLTDVIGAIWLVQSQVEDLGGESTPAYSTLFKFDSDGRVVRRD